MLIGPEFLAGAPQCKQRVVLDSVVHAVLTPVLIPVHQIRIFGRDVLSCWDGLGTFPSGIVVVSAAKQAPATGCCFKQHPIATGVGRTVRDAVLNYVDVDSRTKGFFARLLCRTLHDLLDREIKLFGMLSMKQGNDNPNLIGDLNASDRRSSFHKA